MKHFSKYDVKPDRSGLAAGFRALAVCLAAILVPFFASSDNCYWNGSAANQWWTTVANWSKSDGSPSPYAPNAGGNDERRNAFVQTDSRLTGSRTVMFNALTSNRGSLTIEGGTRDDPLAFESYNSGWGIRGVRYLSDNRCYSSVFTLGASRASYVFMIGGSYGPFGGSSSIGANNSNHSVLVMDGTSVGTSLAIVGETGSDKATLSIENADLYMTNATIRATQDVKFGNREGVSSYVDIYGANSASTSGDWTYIASGKNASVVLNLNRGRIRSTSASGQLRIGSGEGSRAVVTNLDGKMEFARFSMSEGKNAKTYLYQKDGSLTVSSDYMLLVSNSGSTSAVAEYILDGGTIDVRSASHGIIIGDLGGVGCSSRMVVTNGTVTTAGFLDVGRWTSGTLDMQSGTIDVASEVVLSRDCSAGEDSYLYLRGGVISAQSVRAGTAGASSYLVFDGGEFRATAPGIFIPAGDKFHVSATSRGGVINTDGNVLTIGEDLADSAGEAGRYTFKGGDSVCVTGTMSHTGGTGIEICTTLKVSDAASARSVVSGGVVAIVPDTIPDIAKYHLLERTDGGTFTDADLASFSFSDEEAARAHSMFFVLSSDAKAVCVVVQGPPSGYIWTGGGDAVHFSDPLNWQGGAAPSSGGEDVYVATPTNATLVCDISGFRPDLLVFAYGSEEVTIAGPASISCGQIFNVTDIHHIIDTPVVAPSSAEVVLSLREENYIDFAGGIRAYTLARKKSTSYLKGRFTFTIGTWFSSQRDAAVILPGSFVSVPEYVADTDPGGFSVMEDAELSVTGNAILRSSAEERRRLVHVNDGCVRVGGSVLAEENVNPYPSSSGSGVFAAAGVVNSSTTDSFHLNNYDMDSEMTHWVVGSLGMGSTSGNGFWIELGGDSSSRHGGGVRLQASADFSVTAEVGARQEFVIDTDGPDGASHTITFERAVFREPYGDSSNDMTILGSGQVIFKGDSFSKDLPYTADLHVGGDAAISVLVEASVTRGNIEFAEGATFIVPDAGMETGSAEIGGEFAFAGGNTVVVSNLDVRADAVMKAASLSAAGSVDFLFLGNELPERVQIPVMKLTGGVRADILELFTASGDAIPEGAGVSFYIFGDTICLMVGSPVAKVGEEYYYTLFDAAAASSPSERAVMLRNTDEFVYLHDGQTLYLSEDLYTFRGMFFGDGAVNMDARPAVYTYASGLNGPALFGEGWSGTFEIGWAEGDNRFVFNDFGTAESTVKIAVSPFFYGFSASQWSQGSTTNILPKIVLGEGLVWQVNNGWGGDKSRYLSILSQLSGEGDFIVSGTSSGAASNWALHYYIDVLTNFTGTLGGGVRDRVHFSFGNICFDSPQFGVPLVRLDATANVDGIGETLINGASVPIAVGEENGQRGIYLARAVFDGTPYVSVDEAIAVAEASEGAEVYVLDGSEVPKAGWEWDAAGRKYTRYVAEVDGIKFASLQRAYAYATAQEIGLITLLGATSEDVDLPSWMTLDCGVVPYGGEVSGSGTLKISRKPKASTGFMPSLASGWEGRFVLDWSGGPHERLNANFYGNSNSVVEVTGFASGYARDDSSEDPFVVVPLIDVSGYLMLDNRFADYSNPFAEPTMKKTVLDRVTGDGQLVLANASCDIGTFERFTGVFATTNGYDELGTIPDSPDEGATVGAIITDSPVAAGVCFLRTTATTILHSIDEITVNGISTNLIFDAAAAQPGLYLPGAQVIRLDAETGAEEVFGTYAFFSDAARAADGEWLVSLCADCGDYTMTPGETVRVRANGCSVSLVAPDGAEIASETDGTFADAVAYTCVSLVPDELYRVSADGTPDGVDYNDGASAFTAAFAAEGSVITVEVVSGDGPSLEGELASRVEAFFVCNGQRTVYTMYRDSNADLFTVAASDVARLRDAGIADPTAVPSGWSLSYAQAAALGLLTVDGLDVSAEPFAVTSISVDSAAGTAAVGTNGSPRDEYSVICHLLAKRSLADEWPDVSAAVDSAPLGETLVDPGATPVQKFYRVVPVISNK